ncbi:MAG TPA: sodium:dicarboxylate symporter [Candidatus Latescibacteria bacterium]|nr:sodium:dicarboxylate symporter [Candidatus Latescibacterota bacterium]
MGLDTNSRSRRTSQVGLVLGPFIFFLVLLGFDLEPGHPEVTRTAAVALLMAVWWMTEAIPLAATALIPVVLFPALGIMDGRTVAPIYFNHIIFLFIGGFLVALAMQRWDLHRRIALRILLLFGVQPARILLGFMVATAFLSMWISNTATTMMMVPIVLAVVLKLEENAGEERVRRFGTSLFLGVAYGASIGGIATLVGTPPNLSLTRILTIQFPQSPEISFASWFAFGFPISFVFLAIAWCVLRWIFSVRKEGIDLNLHAIKEQYSALGPVSYQEAVVLVDFVLLALLWLFRSNITIGPIFIPGWSSWLANGSLLNDGTIAVAMALVLFVIPARHRSAGRLMDWGVAKNLPWHIVLLFGGGFALASGFKDSGLSQWFGVQLQGLGVLHPLGLVASLCLMITFLTELTSNTATAEMLLPILGSLGIAVKQNPMLFMIPGTLSCSFAFMLPVATPPNAIVFGTDKVKISDMVRAGVVLNFIGVGLIVLAIYTLGTVVLDVGATGLPGWAEIE